MEIWPEKHRPLLAGVIGAAANVGFALVGLIGQLAQRVGECPGIAWRDALVFDVDRHRGSVVSLLFQVEYLVVAPSAGTGYKVRKTKLEF